MINQQMITLLRKPLAKYLIVGGLAFIVEYASFLMLYRMASLALVFANVISFCLGLLTSFLLNRLWTFASGTYKRAAHHQFGFYSALSVVNLFATVLLVNWLKKVGINPNIGKLLAMVITSSWNFLFYKYAIFHHQPLEED